MKPIPFLAAVIFIGAVAVIPVQSLAQVSVNLMLGDAPPPVRYEVVPAARPGYLWAPGFWNWNGRGHVWSAGHWERARSGQLYEPAEWRQDGDQWKLKRGEWKRIKHDNGVGKKDKHGNFCPPGQAKKGNC